MKSPIHRHVARPARWLYCARTLLGLEFLAGIIAGIAFGTPLACVFLWFVTHPLCIVLSIREPHIEAVLRVLPHRRPTPNHWQSDDRTYVP